MKKYQFRRRRNKIFVPIIDYILSIYNFFFRQDKEIPSPENVKKVLVVRMDHIGDLVLSLPSLATIRKLYPNAEVTLLVGKWTEELARLIDVVDKVLAFSPSWFSKGNDRNDLKDVIRLIKKLRAKEFDLAIDLRGYFHNILLLHFSKVKFIAGYGITGGGPLLDYEKEFTSGLSRWQYPLNLAIDLGYKGDYELPNLSIPDFSELFTKYNIPQKYILLNPFSRDKKREWALHKWRELIDMIENKGYIPVIAGPSDRISDSRDIGKQGVINLTGRLTFYQWLYLISRANAVIGLNSSAVHLSSYLNVPTVMIAVGIEDIVEWRPLGNVEILYSSHLPCVPCNKPSGCKSMECLSIITPEMVIQCLEKLLRMGI